MGRAAPVQRWPELAQAAVERNVGTWDCDANGKATNGRTIRAKVRKRSSGTEQPVVCAGQYSVREGLSPSEVLMRDNISENWCKKLVGPGGQRDHKGGQGVYREVESGRHEEKDRAVIKEATPDEPVGQRWGKVESALWGRRRYSFTHRNKVYAGGTIRKNRAMTPGELVVLPLWQRHKRPDKQASETGSKARGVVGPSNSTEQGR
jgi:hypothetical protein